MAARVLPSRSRTPEATLHVVDASLAGLPPRGLLSGKEAHRLLFDLDIDLADTADPSLSDAAHAVLAESLASIEGWPVVDRIRVENPLLDVRNLITSRDA